MKKRSLRRKRKFKLGAIVARKMEEHAKLTRDAMKIAIVLALAVAAFMAVNVFYGAWRDLQQAAAPVVKPARR